MKVKIKTWASMKKNFGTDSDNDIRVSKNICFTASMETMLPKDRIIKINNSSNGNYRWNDTYNDSWTISCDMIEYIIDDTESSYGTILPL